MKRDLPQRTEATPDDLVNAGDEALYDIKHSGRNNNFIKFHDQAKREDKWTGDEFFSNLTIKDMLKDLFLGMMTGRFKKKQKDKK